MERATGRRRAWSGGRVTVQMGRVIRPVAVVLAFGLGLAAGALPGRDESPPREVERLQRQVAALEAERLARETRRAGEEPARAASPASPPAGQTRAATHGSLTAAAVDELDASSPPEPGGAPRTGRPAPAPRVGPAPASPVDAALERFYLYFDDPNPSGSRWERWRRLADDLRGMGSAGSEALMRVLDAASSSEERRAAARLLGQLRAAEALPLLQDVLDRDADVLLRRDAATALRRLRTPDAAPYLEALVRDSREDRYVRLSAASGLAQLGSSQGVAGLVRIFEESERDGRWRDTAFRALRSQKDERTLSFMRDLVASDAEVTYRLQAIRFVKDKSDRRALPALERVMVSAGEQPSLREAAAQAHAAILSR
jgi:hypothetical protein